MNWHELNNKRFFHAVIGSRLGSACFGTTVKDVYQQIDREAQASSRFVLEEERPFDGCFQEVVRGVVKQIAKYKITNDGASL